MMKNANASLGWVTFFFGALSIQMMSLVGFIEASRVEQSAALKIVAALFAFALSIVFVIWAQKRSRNIMGLIAHATVLASAYLLAFHLAGFLMYKGLLSDLHGDDFSYAISLLKVFGLLFSAYLVGELIVRWIFIKILPNGLK